MTTTENLTTAQQTTITELEVQHGPAYWRTAHQFNGPLTSGLNLCFADGYGFIVTAQGVAVPA